MPVRAGAWRSRETDCRLTEPAGATEAFPFRGPTEFKGLEDFPEVQADPQVIRRAYLDELNAFRRALEEECRHLHIDYFLLRTDQPLDAALTSVLATRERSVR